jgi:cysteine desulfurase/selenocysteine lyase
MGYGIKYMNKYDDFNHKKNLVKYAYDQLSKIPNIDFISKRDDYNVLFRIKGISSQEIVNYLGYRNIILRSGKHCALYLFNTFKLEDVIRMSFAIYNEKSDIDFVVKEIKKGGNFIDIT